MMKPQKISMTALLALGFPLVALAQPNETPTTIIDPSNQAHVQNTPPVLRAGEPKAQIEADVKALLSRLNALSNEAPDYNFEIPALISGARNGYFGFSEWADYFVQQRGKTQYRFDKIDFETLDKDRASVKIFYSLLTPDNVAPIVENPPKPALITENKSEILDLKREIVPWFGDDAGNDRWRMMAPTRENLQPYQTLSLQNIAYFASQRAGILPQLRGEISATRLKQSALGTLQFVQDYDEIYRFQNEFWPIAIRPYVQKQSIFLIPGSQIPYTFNDNLSDKSIADINEVAQTVLFYEGTDEKPIFRYEGKAAIAFVDGHSALVTPDAVKTLIWRP